MPTTSFFIISGAVFIISVVLWRFFGRHLIPMADYLERPGVNFFGLFMFLAALALLAFGQNLPQPWVNNFAVILMFCYFFPLLFRMGSVLSGGIEKHRSKSQDQADR